MRAVREGPVPWHFPPLPWPGCSTDSTAAAVTSHSIIRLGLGSNLYSVMAFQLGVVLLAAVLFVPGLQIMFAAADLSLSQLTTLAAAAFLPTLAIQIHKILRESIY